MEKWNKRFDGISSYNVSQKLGISHKKVREVFKFFRRQNKGTLNDNVVLRRLDPKDQKEEIVTTVFYPSKDSLKESFRKSKFAQKNIAEFKKRLYLGHRRNELAYFSKSVLNKYFNLKDKFNIQDSFIGGFLNSNSSYIKSLAKDKIPQEMVSTLRFGKRKLGKSDQVVTAILDDLAQLPAVEQEHWYFSEIESPNFSDFDPDFHKYYLRYYDGNPVHTRDPLNKLLEILNKINALPHVGKVFNNLQNIELRYPVGRNKEDFCNSCIQLYKIVGPENLNIKILKQYLHNNYNYKDNDFLDDEGHTALGNEKLFKKFLREIDFLQSSIEVLLEEVKNHTTSDDRTSNLTHNQPDFLSEFKEMCQSLLLSYTILYEELRNGADVQKNIPVVS